MISFLVVSFVLLLGVTGILCYRLLRAPGDAGADDAVDALGVLRDQRRELDAEVAAGRMSAEERETRIGELTRRVHDEGLAVTADAAVATGAGAGAASATATRLTQATRGRRNVWLAALVALLVPVIAIPIYLAIGNPAALDPAMRASSASASGHGEMNEEQIRAILAQLREKLDKNPNDLKGWTMLGRGLRVVNDFDGSALAFEKASMLAPDDAAVLADWADSLGMTQNRSLEGKPRELIQRALKADPTHPKALALAASAEYAAGKLPEAKLYWERLLAIVPPDSGSAVEVREILAQLDKRISGSGGAPAAAGASANASASAAPKAAAGAPQTTTAGAQQATIAGPQQATSAGAQQATPGGAPKGATAGAAITGTVKLSPSLASKIAPGDALFIFARAVDGPRMPVAILRGTAGELPKAFRLDDSMGMAGGPTLSSIAQVKVEARISKTGDAMPKPGDLRGESAAISPGMSNVDVVIDKVVP